MGNYNKRIIRAQRKHPELFCGIVDICIIHADHCPKLKGDQPCHCQPDIVITAKQGKFSIGHAGQCKKLGASAELLPTIYDPRDPELN
jgi:hypothetical protein